MTIIVRIENTDTREGAVISFQAINPDGSECPGATVVELKAGESGTVAIHSGIMALVKEVSNG